MWVKMGERWRWVGVGRNGWGLVEECESGWRWVGVGGVGQSWLKVSGVGRG